MVFGERQKQQDYRAYLKSDRCMRQSFHGFVALQLHQ